MEREITFDGFDGPDLVCPFINVWSDYNKRKKSVIKAKHGERGVLLERRGNACKVRIKREGQKAKVGWVTFWFIKQLKLKWQEGRT